MFTVTVRDHMMIAHSLSGDVFGPAQQLHGATYLVDASFRRSELNDHGIVVDIAIASEVLHEIVGEFTHRNLDDDPAFAQRNSTTEVLAQVVVDRLCEAAQSGRFGPDGGALDSIAVTLHESHVAWASYERRLQSTE